MGLGKIKLKIMQIHEDYDSPQINANMSGWMLEYNEGNMDAFIKNMQIH